MGGGLRYAADSLENVIGIERCSGGNRLSASEFRESRAAGDGWNAAFGLKTNFCDDVPPERSAKLQHISANGVVHLRRGMRLGQDTGIPRVLKMIEKLRRIHGEHFMPEEESTPPV